MEHNKRYNLFVIRSEGNNTLNLAFFLTESSIHYHTNPWRKNDQIS